MSKKSKRVDITKKIKKVNKEANKRLKITSVSTAPDKLVKPAL